MTLTFFGHVALLIITVYNMKPGTMQHLISKIFLGNFFYKFVKEPRCFHFITIPRLPDLTYWELTRRAIQINEQLKLAA